MTLYYVKSFNKGDMVWVSVCAGPPSKLPSMFLDYAANPVLYDRKIFEKMTGRKVSDNFKYGVIEDWPWSMLR